MSSEEKISGVIVKNIKEHQDKRGWLAELYRTDDPEDYSVAMGYMSVTHPGFVRGPHEHVEQTDYFCFFGDFSLYLWDNRKESPTFGNRMVIENAARLIVVVPPGVVHAYKNSGSTEGIVLNFPDRLYAGKGRKEKVDEVRHEDDPESRFKVK